jgi:hypothetical protein
VDVGRILAVALHLPLVDDAAALRGGDADHHVEVVLLGKLRPAVDDVTVVLRRRGQPRRLLTPSW